MDKVWLEVSTEACEGNEISWIEGLCKKIKESRDVGEPFYLESISIDYDSFTDFENVITVDNIDAAPQA